MRAAPFRDSSYGAWEGSNGVMCSAITSRGVLAIVLAIDYGKLDAAESWCCGAVRFFQNVKQAYQAHCCSYLLAFTELEIERNKSRLRDTIVRGAIFS